jgi:membrane peptidoglycan carboxypeptidase
VCASVRGYTVAGKTGTSRKALPTGGYAAGKHIATFVGFAPAEAPRLAAVVVVDEPRQTYGGRAAAPVFAEIMQDALRATRVPPSPTVPGATNQWDAAWIAANSEGVDCGVPHGGALAELLAERTSAANAANGTSDANETSTAGDASTASDAGGTRASSSAGAADTLPSATVPADPSG